jgi:ribA/ribD-fused uncharacterized protein
MSDIISFTKVKLPFGWLGNMSPHPITWMDMEWRTSEALFQALRFDLQNREGLADSLLDIREEIRSQTSPMAAKMVAKRERDKMVVQPQSDRDCVHMGLVLQLKLEQHPQLLSMLDATGNARIIEDVTKRPHGSGLFWGAALQDDGTWKGENWLGRIWMKTREITREAKAFQKG